MRGTRQLVIATVFNWLVFIGALLMMLDLHSIINRGGFAQYLYSIRDFLLMTALILFFTSVFMTRFLILNRRINQRLAQLEQRAADDATLRDLLTDPAEAEALSPDEKIYLIEYLTTTLRADVRPARKSKRDFYEDDGEPERLRR